MSYKQAFEDWSYLWAYGAAEDMTGAYVDQGDLDKLLRSPTKKTAQECLESQIAYWFQVGPDPFQDKGPFSLFIPQIKFVEPSVYSHLWEG